MKIAFVANTCWNIFNFRKGLVHHFLSKGDEVLVLAPLDEYTESIIEWGVKWVETPLDGTGVNPISDIRYLKTIYSTFEKEQPNVALSFTIKSNIYSCLAGKLTSVPVICNVSGLGTVFLVKGFTGEIAMLLYRVAFRYAKQIFFQNEDDKKLFQSYIKVSDSLVEVLPGSGIDLTAFSFTEIKAVEKVKCLMVSRLIVEKGVREYAQAASHFVDDERVSFTLVGKLDEGHSRSIDQSELEEWQQKGWLNYLPHSNEINELISEHELIILPSYREGTPRTLLEGAAIGRALLSSNVAGCKEVVMDGFNGFLFEVKNHKSIIDKIKLYLSMNESERLQMGANSRKLVEERYDERIVIDKYNDSIRRITDSA